MHPVQYPRAADRRSVLLGAAGLAALAAAPRRALAQAAPAAPAAGPYTLPALPYANNANEPHIDAQTMELHHDRHHAAYVTNLNAALGDHPRVSAKPIAAILADLDAVPEAVRTAVRNNGGGHANHTMFWTIMGGRGGSPTGELGAAVDRDLGGVDKLRADFNGMGARRFGSGWVFVTVARGGELALVDLPNQDSPWMSGRIPLMGNDVWEHAYYLRYQNRRPDYLAAWWNVVDWDAVARRYVAAKAGTLAV